MIGDLKPYAEYKESGSRWLSTVPSHWDVRKLRTLIRTRNERNRPDLPLLSVAREKGVFVRSLTNADENHNVIPEDLTNYKVARAGCLVINKMKAWQGSMGIAPVDGIVSPAYYVYDLDISNRLFGQVLLRSKPYVAHFGQASDGVRVGQWDLTISGMRAIPVLIPPPEEQAAIVRFLDWANGRLERAIRAKRKVIALLNEQKQAIIYRAVTRGLDPSVPLKPSGIPWIGEIPAHWEVMAVKHVLQCLVDCEHKTAPYVEQSDFRVVRTSAVRNGEIRWDGTYCTTAVAFAEWTKRAPPEAGDVIFTREAPVGEACLVPEMSQVCLGQRTVLMKVRTQIYDSKFLIHMIYAGPPRLCIDLASQGSTVGHFNMDDIGWMKVFAPPLNEQRQIVDSISNETADLRLTIERTEQEIDLLREYRTRLVADVVTGKLDVREAASRLPNEELLPDLVTTDDEPDDQPIEEEDDACTVSAPGTIS